MHESLRVYTGLKGTTALKFQQLAQQTGVSHSALVKLAIAKLVNEDHKDTAASLNRVLSNWSC